MFQGIRHTGITVSDLDRSLELYRDTFGMRTVRTADQKGEFISTLVNIPGVHLRAVVLQHPEGGHQLELVEYVTPKGEHVECQPNSVGAAHISLGFDDLDAILPVLHEKGVVPSEVQTIAEGPLAGGRVAYARDPDGIILELYGPARRD